MAQITNGIRGVLSSPKIYDAFQILMGGRRGRSDFAQRFIRASAGDKVLDIGCGTAELLAYLPEVQYWGYDISNPYIEAARARYGARGCFTCKFLDEEDLVKLPRFDMVIASGVIHHLNEEAVIRLFELAKAALHPRGRFVSIDPVLSEKQNPIARLLVSYDRGQNVCDAEGYLRLARKSFGQVTGTERHQAWIPYSHWILECQ
jgi:SAM-dependent methyltransferase